MGLAGRQTWSTFHYLALAAAEIFPFDLQKRATPLYRISLRPLNQTEYFS